MPWSMLMGPSDVSCALLALCEQVQGAELSTVQVHSGSNQLSHAIGADAMSQCTRRMLSGSDAYASCARRMTEPRRNRFA